MVLILFSWCLWLTLVIVQCLLPAAQEVLSIETHPRHDKNWWLWNLEAKRKPLGTSSQGKEDKNNRKLVFKRSVHSLEPGKALIFEGDMSKYHNSRKRWLSSSFGFGSRKNMGKESRKWLIDSQSSGSNSSANVPVIQDPWVSKRKRVDRNRTEIKFRKHSSRSRGYFKKRVHPQTSQQQRHFDSHPASVDNILFGSSDHADHTSDSLVEQRYQTLIPGPTMKTYGDLKPLSSVYTQVWNKSYDPIYGRYVTPFTELKFNPLRHPYPFHDPRSSIPWYTPLRHKAEPTRKFGNPSVNGRVMNKQVAKSKGKSESMKQGGRNDEIELIPKVYALSTLKDKKQLKKFSSQHGWSNSATNPLIVPGYNRKFIDIAAPDDETMRPFIVRAGEQAGIPFNDDYIQVSRGNKNRAKLDNANNDQRPSFAGPLQLPGPYAFPGGVNISILVPNLPVPSHEASQITTSMSTEKNSKKKKERKKKFKIEDGLRDELLSAPRSQVTPRTDTDQSLSRGMELIKYQPLNRDVKYPVFNFNPKNFSLLNHIRNISLDQVNWENAFGVQTESAKRSELSYDDDDDEIRLLYDEHPSTTTQQSTEKVMDKSWYRFTNYVSKIPNAPRGEKFRNVDDPSDVTEATLLGGVYEQPENLGTVPHSGEEPANASKPNSCHKFSGASRDQWDVLDEDLKSIVNGKRNVFWKLTNRKREASFGNNERDAQGYYDLSSGENVLRNPTGLIISVFRKKSNKHRDRDYYDEIPEDKISGRKRVED